MPTKDPRINVVVENPLYERVTVQGFTVQWFTVWRLIGGLSAKGLPFR